MKRMIVVYSVLVCLCCFFVISYKQFLLKKNSKKLFNIVLIGAAGSGKGTQGDLMKNELNLLQVSAGEVLRQYCKDPNAKYTKKIKQYTDSGKLVPTKITHKLIGEYISKNVFCKDCKYGGVIFDGFPRQMEQLEFLDKFLAKHNNKIDAVVSIEIPMEDLVDRLSGRFACAKCGELYHKTSKPTKQEGVCDKCGGKEFVVREDDKNIDAIRARFKIFEDTTKPVLDVYKQRNIVVSVDGTKGAKEISSELIAKLKTIKEQN